MQANGWWQAKTDQGDDLDRFRIHWQAQTAICPQGKRSMRWTPSRTPHGQETITIAFSFGDCTPCPARSLCTRAKATPRSLSLRPEPQHQAIPSARQRQATPAFQGRVRRPCWHRGHPLARSSRLRAPPGALPRAGEEPSPARRHRGRHEPGPTLCLASGTTPRPHPPVTVRCSCCLTGIRQRYRDTANFEQ